VPWGGERKLICKVCGKPREPGEILSARGKHRACGNARFKANAIQLHQHDGPFFDHWRRQCLAAFGVVALDADDNATQTAD
jgi:hypothetical protein